MSGKRTSFGVLLMLFLLSSSLCVFAGEIGWAKTKVGRGVTLPYPANWKIIHFKPLTMFSPGKRLEGVGIGPGTAEIMVFDEGQKTFDQFVSEARDDDGILSVANLPHSGVRGCAHLRRAVALENDGPPEARATMVQTGFSCERGARSVLIVMRHWRDPKCNYFQRIAERMARGIRFW